MRILILDEEFPYPTDTGKRTRTFNLTRRLAAKHDIHYVAFGQNDSMSVTKFRECHIYAVPVEQRIQTKTGLGFYWRLLINLASPLPYIVTSHTTREYQAIVNREIEHFQPDLVLVEWTPYASYVRNLRRVPVLLVTHNVEYRIWERYAASETNLFRRLYIHEQRRKVKSFEIAALGWATAATCVSALDCDDIRALGASLPVKIIDNGVDLDYFSRLPFRGDESGFVFSGSMDWRPNQDAMRYYATDIKSHLPSRYQEMPCTFVGRNPPSNLMTIASTSGIELTGTVADVRPHIAARAVYIVPLRIGGGTRLKILEAFAMGRPVVSTSIGAEGLKVAHGVHLLIADSPIDFAHSMVLLSEDRDLAQRLILNGRKLVEEKYGWDALAQSLSDFAVETVKTFSPN